MELLIKTLHKFRDAGVFVSLLGYLKFNLISKIHFSRMMTSFSMVSSPPLPNIMSGSQGVLCNACELRFWDNVKLVRMGTSDY